MATQADFEAALRLRPDYDRRPRDGVWRSP